MKTACTATAEDLDFEGLDSLRIDDSAVGEDVGGNFDGTFRRSGSIGDDEGRENDDSWTFKVLSLYK